MKGAMTTANLPLRAGLLLLAAFLAAAVVGLGVESHPPHKLADALLPPSAAHWLGCDPYGVDLGSRVLAGAAHSLRIGLVVTALSLGLGLLVGTLAALGGGIIETVLARVMDVFLSFPGLLLAILLSSAMPRSEYSIVIALGVMGWPSRARFARALVRKTLAEPYVEAARASGAGLARLLGRHVWPAMLGQFAVQGALSMGYVILAEASLSFLGLGGGADNQSWGKLIADGREYLVEAPHLSLFPGIIFVASVVCFNLLAEGLRNKLDPSTRPGLY